MMNLNREELIQKRDTEFASLMDKLKAENSELSGKELAEQVERIHDLVLTVEMNKDLDNRVTDKRLKGVYGKLMQVLETKHIRTLVLVFLAGIIITLIPTLLYISSLKDNNLPEFRFVPNAIGYRIDAYDQMLFTQEEVDLVKKSSIRDAHLASIGATVTLEGEGLFVVTAKEMKSNKYKITHLQSQKSKAKTINNYTFIPNIRIEFGPLETQIIKTQMEIELAKEAKWLDNRSALEIGTGIQCLDTKVCYVLPKKVLDTMYTKIVPISEL